LTDAATSVLATGVGLGVDSAGAGVVLAAAEGVAALNPGSVWNPASGVALSLANGAHPKKAVPYSIIPKKTPLRKAEQMSAWFARAVRGRTRAVRATDAAAAVRR